MSTWWAGARAVKFGLAAVLAAAALVAAGPANAGGSSINGVQRMSRSATLINCGYLTCSVYLSKSQTRWAKYNIDKLGGGYGALAANCGLIASMSGPAAPVVGIACGAAMAVEGGFLLSAIEHAGGDGGCLRIRTPVWWFYDDHSGYCRP